MPGVGFVKFRISLFLVKSLSELFCVTVGGVGVLLVMCVLSRRQSDIVHKKA